MKATGIVRRIDDLGRVVIPKEIRRTLKIHDGSPLEIFTETDGSVVFRKYSQVSEMADFAQDFARVFFETAGAPCCITDLDLVVAASGKPAKELVGRRIGEKLRAALLERKAHAGGVEVTEESDVKAGCLYPILVSGDVVGAVVTLQTEKQGDLSLPVKLTANLIGCQME